MRAGTYLFLMTILFIVGAIASGEENKEKGKIPHKYCIHLDKDWFPEYYITDSIIYHNDRVEFYDKYDSVGMVIYTWNIDKIEKK